jgi:membrane protease YdiL (CAAX protease family)
MEPDFSPFAGAGGEPIADPSSRPQPGYGDLLLATAFALLSLGVCVALGGVALESYKRLTGAQISIDDGATQLLMMLLVIQGVWWAVIMAFLYFVVTVLKYRIPFRRGAGVASGRLANQPCFAGGFAMAIAVTALANILPMPAEPSPLEELLAEATQFLPLFVVFGVLIAPAVEEVVFRGFVYGSLERAHGATAAVRSW